MPGLLGAGEAARMWAPRGAVLTAVLPPLRRELRQKDCARVQAVLDDLAAKEKRGLTKDQKEEREHAAKILEFLQTGTDVRCLSSPQCCAQRGYERAL